MMLSRRAVLGAGVVALAAPILAQGGLGVLAQPAATRIAGVAELWGMGFWSPDAATLAIASLARRPAVLAPHGWHPEFA